MPSITSVEKLTGDLEHTDPEETSSPVMALSHHLLIYLLPQGRLPPWFPYRRQILA